MIYAHPLYIPEAERYTTTATLSSRIVRRGGYGNEGMINNHLQRRRRRSVSITLHSSRPLPPSLPLSGVGFGQNYLEFFDSHPILHTWRWCSTLHRFVAWHLIFAGEVNPQTLAAARARFGRDYFTRGKTLFWRRKMEQAQAPTRDCCGTCKILSTILVGGSLSWITRISYLC